VRNVHLNKSISTIAVQREANGVISYERNMAAVVPVNSVVKFHPSEQHNLPVAITEISNGSRWVYAFVSQNLAVDGLKRLLQRRRSPSFDPLTQNIHTVLHRFSLFFVIVASVVLFASVRDPMSDLSVAFRSIAVILMPLLPSMVSLSLSLSVAVINASMSSQANLSSSPVEGSVKRASVAKTYSRLEDSAQESSVFRKWPCSNCFSKVASYIRSALQVRALPAVSDDNQNPVEISIVSVIGWLFNAWNRMFHEFNHMHLMSRITVFCVLDKEGILAQPQPEAKYVMHPRAVADALTPRSLSRTSSASSADISRVFSAADIVDASFVTNPIVLNDNGKWEFRFDSDSDRKRYQFNFKLIAVCSILTTSKLDIDEDVPKPANSCVKGLTDLCTMINELYDDKSVPVKDKVPVWKEYLDLISPGKCSAIAIVTPLILVIRSFHIIRSATRPVAQNARRGHVWWGAACVARQVGQQHH
jgi:hypothetical protein